MCLSGIHAAYRKDPCYTSCGLLQLSFFIACVHEGALSNHEAFAYRSGTICFLLWPVPLAAILPRWWSCWLQPRSRRPPRQKTLLVCSYAAKKTEKAPRASTQLRLIGLPSGAVRIHSKSNNVTVSWGHGESLVQLCCTTLFFHLAFLTRGRLLRVANCQIRWQWCMKNNLHTSAC